MSVGGSVLWDLRLVEELDLIRRTDILRQRRNTITVDETKFMPRSRCRFAVNASDWAVAVAECRHIPTRNIPVCSLLNICFFGIRPRFYLIHFLRLKVIANIRTLRIIYSIFYRFNLEWKTRTLDVFTQAA